MFHRSCCVEFENSGRCTGPDGVASESEVEAVRLDVGILWRKRSCGEEALDVMHERCESSRDHLHEERRQ